MAAPMGCLEPVEGEGSTGSRASGVELSLPSDPAAPAPLCPHGGSVSVLSLTKGILGLVCGRGKAFLRPSSSPCVMLEYHPFSESVFPCV